MKRFLEKYHLLPKHTEVSLFLMSLSFCFILFSESELRASIWRLVLMGEGYFWFALVSLIGALLSLYYALDLKKSPPEFARFCMITFAVVIEAQAGILLALYHMKDPSTWNLVFAALNGIQAFFLLIMYRMNKINASNVSTYNAKSRELIVGGLFVTFIFIMSSFVMDLAWQMTYSILVTYSATLNSVLVGKAAETAE